LLRLDLRLLLVTGRPLEVMLRLDQTGLVLLLLLLTSSRREMRIVVMVVI
jgi:hypothetical protein